MTNKDSEKNGPPTDNRLSGGGDTELLLRAIFPGESEMASRMRAFDWSTIDLGPPQDWPENLRMAVSLCLTSRFPILIWWGLNLSVLYNDACIPFLGELKHPRYLGQPGRDCWEEIWDTIGPMLESVYATGEATWSDDSLYFFARRLPREEVYVTFTYGPILAADGRSVQGIFCPCTETTERVVGTRRLETLRKLSAQALETRTVNAACEEAAKVLAENPYDIPFAAIYLVNDEGTHAVLKSLVGFSQDAHPFPSAVSLAEGDLSPWPLASVLQTRRGEETSDLMEAGLQLPGGPWPEPSSKAIVLPIFGAQHKSLSGLAVLGVGPRRTLDDAYRTFFDLIAGHIGTAISDAKAYEAEQKRAEALAELDRAKEAQHRSEERFRRYFELGLIGMAITSPTKGIIEVNDEICKILGYERSELLQMTWAELTHPDDLGADVAQLNRVMAGEIDGHSMDKRWIRKDGQVIDATISVKCLGRADGAVDYFVAFLQDVTERKRTEEALRRAHDELEQRVIERTCQLSAINEELIKEITERERAEEALRVSNRRIEHILESITDQFYAMDREWRFTYINERALGYIQRAKGKELTREDLLGKNAWEVFPELVGSVYDQKYHEALREQKTVHFEVYYPPNDTWGDMHAYPSEEGLSVYWQDITERKRAEEKLRRSEAYLAEGQRISHTGSWAVKLPSEDVFWSQEVYRIYGLDPATTKLTQQMAFQLIHLEDRPFVKAAFERALREKSDYAVEHRAILPDGSIKHLHALGHPVLNESGTLTEYVGTVMDITERKRAEELLRKAHERVDMILDSITDQFFAFDSDWRFTYLNKHAAEQMKALGKDPARLIGSVLWDEFPDVPNEEAVRRVMSERVAITDELYYAPLGEWVENHMYPGHDGGLVTFQKYITERKRAEEAATAAKEEAERRAREAEEAQSMLHTILEHAPVGITMAGGPPDFPIIVNSQHAGTLLGREPGTLLNIPAGSHGEAFGLWMSDGVTRPRPEQLPLYRATRHGEVIENEEWIIERPDGSRIHKLANVAPIRDFEGRIIGAINCWHDITERKRAEVELALLKDELAVDLEAMERLYELSTRLLTADGLQSLLEEILSATINLQHADFGNVQVYNPQTKSLEIVVQRGFKQDFLDHFSVVAEDSSACGRALQRGERVIIEDVESDPGFEPHRQIAASAGFRAVQSTPLVSRSGEPLGMLSTHFRDPHRPSERELRLTDLYARQVAEMIERAEEALHEARAALAHVTRVMTMGELIATIAHEVNQPLGAIVTNGQACLRLLARESPDLHKSREVVERMISDGMRASEVITRIRALLMRNGAEKTLLNVNEIIQEVIALTSTELSRSEIHLQPALAAGLPPVLGDRVQLQPVILNLILNAKEAMSGAGWEPRELFITSLASTSGEAVVAVRDSGTGFDPRDCDRIFDAFFTTKAEGLGLSISRRIIEAHGGRLWATPNGDHGATIQFTLPASGSRG